MMVTNPVPTRFGRGKWGWRIGAGLLVLASAGLHLGYLAYHCPLDLAPDEAHYWDWSRHLDWSYYSKGPFVAYLIRAGSVLAGAWSRQMTATDMVAVRLPAVVCGSLLLVSLYILTAQVYRREGLAFAVVALALTLPVVVAGSSLMTIDAPYTCCWGWALVLGYQAMLRGSRWAWPVLGGVIGLGILAKYTMILWIPSAGLFLLASPMYRRLLLSRGFWIMTGVAAAACLPILLWNLRYDWVSLRHVSGQAGLEDRQGILWLGPAEYVGLQFLLLLGFWFIAWVSAMVAHRPWRETDPGVGYLWWMSAPMFGFFFLFSLKTHEEPNWPITAYLSGLVLAAAWLERRLHTPRRTIRQATLAGLAGACALGLFVTVIMHHSEWVQGLLLRLSGPATPQHPLPLRRFDPTCRLRGWRTLAAELDQLRDALRAQGEEPYLAATSWNVPGEIGFYCQGHPDVYSFGLILGVDRHSQYDLWHPNPSSDDGPFRGATFILVGDLPASLFEARAFEQIEPSRVVTHYERSQAVAQWMVTVCRGFRGFHAVAAGVNQASY
ncbi:MAG TPA: glycosyltransferase family 39 protein [Gemmataceae bacterium]|nr:glycosyltransferase family 39 protein [Gemmataceae bacterium]